jgi:hypothetical protein
MKRTRATAATAVLLAALAACSSSNTTSSSGKSGTPHSSHPAAGATAKKTTSPAKTTATPAKKLTTAQARKQAATILKKEDQDFRDFLAQGENVVGTPQFTAWYNKAIVGLDMKQNAFQKADAPFTADNEPTNLIEAWRSDNGDANSRITQYAMDGTAPDAPNATTRKDAADARTALDKADKDAGQIANGS